MLIFFSSSQDWFLLLMVVLRIAAEAVDLAAFHRQDDRRRAVIAAHQFDLGVEYVLVEEREHVGIGAGPVAAEDDRLGQNVVPVLDRGGMPRHAGRDLVGDAAEPRELGAVELRALREQGRDSHLAAEGADGGAVLRRRRIDVLRRPLAAGARQVLHDDVRMAGDVIGNMPRQQTAVDVVAATGLVSRSPG